jgi:ubiquinone/menaquinone biosynthesis C-methylase UbiE
VKVKQKTLTQSFFNAVSEEYYQRHYDPTGNPENYPSQYIRHNYILELINDLPVGRVLDVGVGSGIMACELLKRGWTVEGLDIAEKMVKEANTRVRTLVPSHGSRWRVQAGDAEKLPYEESRFDLLIASGLLEYLEADDAFLVEAHRVLRPGGKAVVTFRNSLFNIFSVNEYTAAAMQEEGAKSLLGELIRQFSEQSDQIDGQLMRRFRDDLIRGCSKVANEVFEPCQDSDPWVFTMERRQHTPAEVRQKFKDMGLSVDRLLFWHFHPFPPIVSRRFPRLTVELGKAMEVLRETPVGAMLASGFIVSAIRR